MDIERQNFINECNPLLSMIKIELIPMDFATQHTNKVAFCTNVDCPVARAAKRFFETKDVSQGVHVLEVEGHRYSVIDGLGNLGFGFTEYERVKAYFEGGGTEPYFIYVESEDKVC
jgi:hypothetical protein